MPVSDQGISVQRYMLVPRTLIFVTHGDQLLLIKGAAGKRLWAGRYNGIGGHVEQGEDFLSAAERELDEETGLKNIDLWLCGTVTIDTGQNPGIALYVFRGESAEKAPLKFSEEGTPTWISQSQILALPLVEDLFILLPKVLGTDLKNPPFAARYYYDQQDQLVVSFGS
ncbi:MAG: NUDIX domain-containing protein, partial [Chloroflexi bacterium]|nr:NUDIX domain-containing protein [Chloroflexota bacterium]